MLLALRYTVDLLGYASAYDDLLAAPSLFQRALIFMLGLPTWIHVLLALGIALYSAWVFWPDFNGLRLAKQRVGKLERRLDQLQPQLEALINKKDADWATLRVEIDDQIMKLERMKNEKDRQDRRFGEVWADRFRTFSSEIAGAGAHTEAICLSYLKEFEERVDARLRVVQEAGHASEVAIRQEVVALRHELASSSSPRTTSDSKT